MLTHSQRQKLIDEMHDESIWAVGVLFKCTAGLLIMVGLAWIGAATTLLEDPARYVSTSAAGEPSHAAPAVVSAQIETVPDEHGSPGVLKALAQHLGRVL